MGKLLGLTFDLGIYAKKGGGVQKFFLTSRSLAEISPPPTPPPAPGHNCKRRSSEENNASWKLLQREVGKAVRPPIYKGGLRVGVGDSESPHL